MNLIYQIVIEKTLNHSQEITSDKIPPPQPTSNILRPCNGLGPKIFSLFAVPVFINPSLTKGTLK